jgi:hypothetical protein
MGAVGAPRSNEELFEGVRQLVEAWCDRRAYGALREVLQGWPLANPLTDGWADLGDALKAVRAFAADELTAEEAVELERYIAAVDKAVYR